MKNVGIRVLASVFVRIWQSFTTSFNSRHSRPFQLLLFSSQTSIQLSLYAAVIAPGVLSISVLLNLFLTFRKHCIFVLKILTLIKKERSHQQTNKSINCRMLVRLLI